VKVPIELVFVKVSIELVLVKVPIELVLVKVPIELVLVKVPIDHFHWCYHFDIDHVITQVEDYGHWIPQAPEGKKRESHRILQKSTGNSRKWKQYC
jgi:hypothetical protein